MRSMFMSKGNFSSPLGERGKNPFGPFFYHGHKEMLQDALKTVLKRRVELGSSLTLRNDLRGVG